MHAGCSLDYYIEYRKVLVLSGRNFLIKRKRVITKVWFMGCEKLKKKYAAAQHQKE